jgi:Protein of unknown function (DUF6044)
VSALRRASPLLVYPILALLAFPTLGTVFRGTAAWAYTLDVFDDGGALPRMAIAVRDWSAHGPTLWDPYLTAGNAFLGQFALPPYSPDVALAFVVGPFWALAISTWLTAGLAGIGTHLFLRDSLRLSSLAVLGGAVMATLCFWHPIYGVSIAILPLVLWLGDRAVTAIPTTGHRRRFVAGWLAAATLSLYAGQAQTAAFVAVIQLAWLLVPGAGARRARVGTWLVIWGLAFALYAPVLFTQLIMLPISQRTVWDLDYLFPGGLTGAATAIARHYLSVVVGLPSLGGLSPGEPRYGTLFLGGTLVVLLVAALLAGRRDRGALFLIVMLLAIPVLDFLAIAGRHIPENVPILSSFQYVRIRHFFPFALSGVVALGIEAIVTARPPFDARRALIVGVGAVLLVPFGIEAAVAARRAGSHLLRFAGTPLDVGYVLITIAMVAGVLGGALLLAAVWRRRPVAAAPLLVALACLFLVDRVALSNGGPLLGPFIGTFDERLALTPGQAFLLGQPGIATQRVLTFGDHANRMAFQGLRQVDGYQAIYPVAYHGFFGEMTAPGLDANPVRWRYFHLWGARAYAFSPMVDPELVSLVGGRWLYVVGDGEPTVPGIVDRFRDGDVTVYENPAAFPRAILVGAVDVAPDRATVLDRLGGASRADLAGWAYLAAADAGQLRPVLDGGTPGPAGTVTVTSETPDRIELDVRADRPAVLVLFDTAAPGWIAEVDGERTLMTTVDGAFRGIAVDPSARHVVFRYGPGFTVLGFIAAGIAAVLAVGWVWLVGRRRPD